jgi:ribosome-associated protein
MSVEDEETPEVSKSQRKREMTALQALGEELVALSAARLARLPLPEGLREAVRAAQQISSRSARRRQLQYIGRLMREVDAEPIRAALAEVKGESREAAARLQRLERWREALIQDGDSALGELLAQHPNADRQHLRRLIRTARDERAQDRPPAAARALLRYLRELTG